MLKNNISIFFGIFLVGIIFISPSMSSTVEAVSETVINECCGDTTVTVNAYINSTSPTGRTLHLAIDSTGNHNTFSAAVMKPDGSWFKGDNWPDPVVFWFSIN